MDSHRHLSCSLVMDKSWDEVIGDDVAVADADDVGRIAAIHDDPRFGIKRGSPEQAEPIIDCQATAE